MSCVRAALSLAHSTWTVLREQTADNHSVECYSKCRQNHHLTILFCGFIEVSLCIHLETGPLCFFFIISRGEKMFLLQGTALGRWISLNIFEARKSWGYWKLHCGRWIADLTYISEPCLYLVINMLTRELCRLTEPHSRYQYCTKRLFSTHRTAIHWHGA